MWEYKTEEETHDMYMDVGEDIRFRVVEEVFVDTLPNKGETHPLNLKLFTLFNNFSGPAIANLNYVVVHWLVRLLKIISLPASEMCTYNCPQ